MALKLQSVSFAGQRIICGVRIEQTIECDRPPPPLKDWRILVRGAHLVMISPPGWTPSNPATREEKGPRVAVEIARSEAILKWSGDEAELTRIVKEYDSQPLGWQPKPVDAEKPLLEQIPPGQVGDA